MNLFCFTLEGSTESIYEPAYSQTLKEARPKHRRGPAPPGRTLEWGGSDPSANSVGAESVHSPGRLKKLQNLMQPKKEHLSRAGKERSAENNDLGNTNPVLTCIGLGMRPEQRPPMDAPSAQQQDHQAQEDQDSDEGVWSPSLGYNLWGPFGSPQPWTPLHHTCHRPQHELWVGGGDVSPPRMTEWDRFESLIQELDGKRSAPSPPQTASAVTDLQLSENTQEEQNGEPTELETSSSHHEWTRVKLSAEKAAIASGDTKKWGAAKRKGDDGGRFRSSVESLYYGLNSGQSSSSGVASGSDCSSNRDSLRLEEDPSNTRPCCGRARVHTDFVPSPYDMESLRLQVGDVIDVVAAPPMGTWTGVLNGRIGNFKFIYVDELTEEGPDSHEETQTHRGRDQSTVQEVLRRLNLEECSSSLQLNGHRTVDDSMTPRERHLMEPRGTDPEFAAGSPLCSSSAPTGPVRRLGPQGETGKADMNNRPRDPGCPM